VHGVSVLLRTVIVDVQMSFDMDQTIAERDLCAESCIIDIDIESWKH